MSQNLNGFGGLAGEFSEGFFCQALLGILRKLVVADPHLLPPDAKPSGGADHQLRWGGTSEYGVLHEKKPSEKEGNESKKKRQQQNERQHMQH